MTQFSKAKDNAYIHQVAAVIKDYMYVEKFSLQTTLKYWPLAICITTRL